MRSPNVTPPLEPSTMCSPSMSHVVPEDWVTVEAQPVPAWMLDVQAAGEALSTLGKAIGPGILDAAKKMGVPLPAELDGPDAEFTPELLITFLRQVCWHLFPQLEPNSGTV